MRPTELERAATILAESLQKRLDPNRTDAKLAKKYGVSERSIKRWRANLATDRELARLVTQKALAEQEAWVADLGPTTRDIIEFFAKAAREADPKDSGAIAALAGAFERLVDAQATWKMLNVRVAEAASTDRAGSRSVASETRPSLN